MGYTMPIPTVSYTGTDPDPVEWANIYVKPAIEDLDTRGGMVRLPASAGPWTFTDTPQGNGYDWMSTGGGTAWLMPFEVAQLDYRVDALAAVTNTVAAGGVIRLGIYATNPDGAPGPLVLDAGTASLGTTGEKIITFTATLLIPRMYWIIQVPSATVEIKRSGGIGPFTQMLKGHNNGSAFDYNGAGIVIYSGGWTATSPLPASARTNIDGGGTANVPLMAIRRAT